MAAAIATTTAIVTAGSAANNQTEGLAAADRFRGCLLGLAAGDAVGAAVEFRPRDSFPPLTDMIGGGVFALAPGQWTDDTSMALCLATSLVTVAGFDAADQMRRVGKKVMFWGLRVLEESSPKP